MTKVKCPHCGREQETDKQSIFCKNKIKVKFVAREDRYSQTRECGGFIVTERDKMK